MCYFLFTLVRILLYHLLTYKITRNMYVLFSMHVSILFLGRQQPCYLKLDVLLVKHKH